MFLFFHNGDSLHIFSKIILVPIYCRRMWIMLKDLQRLPQLATGQTLGTWNLFYDSTGCSCLFSLRNGCHQKKIRKKVSLIFTASCDCSLTYFVLHDEQSDSPRGNDPHNPWYERYSYSCSKMFYWHKILKIHYKRHFVCYCLDKLDTL